VFFDASMGQKKEARVVILPASRLYFKLFLSIF